MKTNYMGFINGANYSQLDLVDYDSNLVINDKATLNAIGIISGNGTIDTLSGGTVIEPLFIKSFRGGTDTGNILLDDDKTFPFDQFTLSNIETKLNINSGAYYKGSVVIYMGFSIFAGHHFSLLSLVGSEESLIELKNGFVSKEFDLTNGKLKLSIQGDANLNDTFVKVGTLGGTTTEQTSIPFDGTWDILIKSGSNLNVTANITLFPGAKLTVEEGANLNIASNNRVTVFNPYEYVTIGSSYSTYPIRAENHYRVRPEFGFTSTTNASFNVYGSVTVQSGAGIGGKVNELGTGKVLLLDGSLNHYDITYVTGSTKAIVQKRTVYFVDEIDNVAEVLITSNRYSGSGAKAMNLTIVVRDKQGNPIPGIEVNLTGGDQTRFTSSTGVTNSSGVFTTTYNAIAGDTGQIIAKVIYNGVEFTNVMKYQP